MAGFDDELQDFENAVNRPVKRQRLEHDQDDMDTFHRHRAFLCSHGKPDMAVAHRPKVVHRVCAKHIFDCIETQLKLMTEFVGLCDFKVDFESQAWSDLNWYDWNYLGQCGDMGSDNISAVSFLEYEELANTDFFTDTAHGIHCDHKLMMDRKGFYNFWMCMAISWNIVHGPDKTHERKHKISSMLAKIYI